VGLDCTVRNAWLSGSFFKAPLKHMVQRILWLMQKVLRYEARLVLREILKPFGLRFRVAGC